MVKFGKVTALTVEVSNADDSARVYGISAKAKIVEGKVESVQNGRVQLLSDGQEKANFSMYNENNTSYNLHNVGADERASVLDAVTEFVDAVLAADTSIFDND